MKPNPIHVTPKQVMAAAAGITSFFLFFRTVNYMQYGFGLSDYLVMAPLIRVGIIGSACIIGFGMGWLLSPQAAKIRMMLFTCAGSVLTMIAIFSNDALGWSLAALLSVVGFSMAIGYWLGRGLRALAEPPTTFGSSYWATTQDIQEKGLFEPGGIRLGTATDGDHERTIHYHGDRHLFTSMITRDGKGTSQIIPNLLTLPNSTLVIDPKGENAMITADARRAMGHDVHIFDPWHIVTNQDEDAACFNPMDWLQAGDVDITENAMILADALVTKDRDVDPFWSQESMAFLQGLILYVATDPMEAGHRHLGRVRELTLLDGEDQQTLFERMLNAPHHVVASTGARCLQKDDKLLSNVIASAQAQTHFLDSPRVQEALSRSDFKFEDLKSKPMSVYLAMPADRLHTFAPLLRIMVQMAITVNARNISVQPKKPVLFILDEMAALGRLNAIEQAYGLMAGYGMQLWGFVQDLAQMEKVYGKGWQSFISNSGMISYGGSADDMTTKYFSSMCGETTVWNFSSAVARAFGSSTGKGGVTSNNSETDTDTRAASQRKLAYPDELRRMNKGKQLLFIDNMPPIIAKRAKWYEHPALKLKGVNLHLK